MTRKETPAGPAPLDPPLGATIAGLRGPQDDRADHRREAGRIASAGRPWEALPAALRRALRDDARGLLAAGAPGSALEKAGYPVSLARQLRRDLGRA